MLVHQRVHGSLESHRQAVPVGLDVVEFRIQDAFDVGQVREHLHQLADVDPMERYGQVAPGVRVGSGIELEGTSAVLGIQPEVSLHMAVLMQVDVVVAVQPVGTEGNDGLLGVELEAQSVVCHRGIQSQVDSLLALAVVVVQLQPRPLRMDERIQTGIEDELAVGGGIAYLGKELHAQRILHHVETDGVQLQAVGAQAVDVGSPVDAPQRRSVKVGKQLVVLEAVHRQVIVYGIIGTCLQAQAQVRQECLQLVLVEPLVLGLCSQLRPKGRECPDDGLDVAPSVQVQVQVAGIGIDAGGVRTQVYVEIEVLRLIVVLFRTEAQVLQCSLAPVCLAEVRTEIECEQCPDMEGE
ncbi:unknown [Bacteroides sp. CAG:462]|nr:unknown [Bacteroides sp. CAG:462]